MPAHAHGFGQRYELPLPLVALPVRRGGGGGAVVRRVRAVPAPRAARRAHPRKSICCADPLGRSSAIPPLVLALRLAALALFVVAVLAGLFGDQNPYRNIAPTLVWIIWWVGLAYIAAFVGDIWGLINPWRTVFDGAQWLYRRLGGRGALGLGLAYPQALGAWPACILLLAFSWTELVYPNAASPVHIAWLAIAYSALTWTGMLVFGRDIWLRTARCSRWCSAPSPASRRPRPETAGCCCGTRRGLL